MPLHHNAHAREEGQAPLAWPGGYLCAPKAFPALVTLATEDVGKSDPDWSCTPLDVEDVLQEGERFVYYAARVLLYLDDI